MRDTKVQPRVGEVDSQRWGRKLTVSGLWARRPQLPVRAWENLRTIDSLLNRGGLLVRRV
jgi:hypothetical protein